MELRKSSYLELDMLKDLQKNLLSIDNELSEIVSDFIECSNDGEYLINIFNDSELIKLLNLQNDWELL